MNNETEAMTGNLQVSAYDKLLQVAAAVERAKFALGLKGFFDPAQTGIGALIDEVLADVPFVDGSQPVWWREPEAAAVERAARAGYEALASGLSGGAGTTTGRWEELPENGRAGWHAAALAIMAVKK